MPRGPVLNESMPPQGLPAPTGGTDAHQSLRKVLGYVDARVIEPACLRLVLTRDSEGADGQLIAQEDRDQLGMMLHTLRATIEGTE